MPERVSLPPVRVQDGQDCSGVVEGPPAGAVGAVAVAALAALEKRYERR